MIIVVAAATIVVVTGLISVVFLYKWSRHLLQCVSVPLKTNTALADWKMPSQMSLFSYTVRCRSCSLEECLCTSSDLELAVREIHFSLSLCHFCASGVCGRRPYLGRTITIWCNKGANCELDAEMEQIAVANDDQVLGLFWALGPHFSPSKSGP